MNKTNTSRETFLVDNWDPFNNWDLCWNQESCCVFVYIADGAILMLNLTAMTCCSWGLARVCVLVCVCLCVCVCVCLDGRFWLLVNIGERNSCSRSHSAERFWAVTLRQLTAHTACKSHTFLKILDHFFVFPLFSPSRIYIAVNTF